MTPTELLATLHARRVQLWAEGERLRYKGPQGALTPELRAELAAHKAEVLALLHAARDAANVLPPIPIARRNADLPLSFAQQRLWFLDRLVPNSPVYNLPMAVQLTGALDIALLARSLHVVVLRHEVLRTTFALVDDHPIQRIAPAPRAPAPIPLLDLQPLVPSQREALTRHFAAVEARRPFELAAGPLLRTALLRLDPASHVLLLTMHHIISDGWSLGLLIREIATLYAAFRAGQPAPLPALPLQYADYAVWQREWLQGAVLDAQRSYWRRQLAELPTLALPTDFPYPPAPSGTGAHLRIVLPPALLAELHALSQYMGVTLFMTLLAGFALLLARLCTHDDVVVGSPIAGRAQAQVEALIGCFVNTLVLRTDLAAARTVGELLERVRTVCLEAYAHQDMPFEQLVEMLQPARDGSRHPLFQVLLVLQNTALPTLELHGLRLEGLEVESGTAKFDLSLSLSETSDGLVGMWEYRADLFETATIERISGQFATLLGGLGSDATQPLAQLPLLTAAERQQLLVDWNASQADYPRDACVQQLIEAQVARTPDAIAVVFDRGQGSGVRGQGLEDKETRRQGLPRVGTRGDKETEDRRSKIEDRGSTIFHPPSSVLSPQSSALSPQSLTYRELNARANCLAHHLRRLGVGPDVPVGLCLERSLELLVAIVGVLKAGGAYLPLDPSYPPERLTFMLEDSRAAVLITTSDERPLDAARGRRATSDERPTTTDQRPRTISDDRSTYGYDISYPNDDQRRPSTTSDDRPATTDQRPATAIQNPKSKIQNPKSKIVHLDADWPAIAAEPPDNPACRARPEHLAYVIYTSGSTGRPKGVMVVQRGLINLCYGLRAFFDDAAVRSIGLITSISFDISVNQIFPTLLFGRTLHIIPDQVKYSSPALLRYLAKHGIHILDSVPSYLQSVLADVAPSRAANVLRYLLIGGERLEQTLLQAIFEQLGTQLAAVNIYGLTEASDINAFKVIECHDLDQLVTVGWPLQNNQIYIVDRSGQLQPIGVPGEICIGGESLSRGYLKRPDLTAERFIPNPFGWGMGDGGWGMEDVPPSPIPHPASPGTRLYKTGDIGRRRADGMIEVLGRLDHQVKIRGYRIEVGEIAAVLMQHESLRECVVVVREDVPGEKRLVAYIVQGSGVRGQGSDPLTSDGLIPDPRSLIPELRTFLQARLPGYMLPSAFVALEELPKTPNGKVDRKALPAPDTGQPTSSTVFVAPRTSVEEILAGIWGAVLGMERVGAQDNFFDLGGHSLLATQVVSRIRQVFQVELPLLALFEAPTVASLAERIEAARLAAPDLLLPPPQPVARDQPIPLSFAQQRLWFLDRLAPGTSTYNIPAAVRLAGALDIAALAQGLHAVVQRHEALRTTFTLVDDRPLQRIAPVPRAPAPIPLLDLQPLAAPQRDAYVRRLATVEARRPFDLAAGPLLRTTLLRLDPQEHVLLLTMHHIISDGWSLGLLIGELAACYDAATTGLPAALPPLPIQYADYAIWQREWLQGTGDRETRRQGDTETRRQGVRRQETGVRSQESDVGERQTQNSKLKTQNYLPNTQHPTPIQAQLAYWQRQLAELPTLALPTDFPYPPIPSGAGAHLRTLLPPALLADLHALSRRVGVTLFMTLLATFQLLLARLCTQDDVVVGSPIAGRTQAATEPLIGCFVNTLVLRTDLAAARTVGELLERVRTVCLEAYAHQDMPFEQLVEMLQPARDGSRHPLFQVLLVLQNTALPALELHGLRLEGLEIESGTAKFDLSLSLSETSDGLVGVWEYRTDLFEAATIVRMLGHFQTLLEGIVAPEQRLADLPLLTEAERQQLLVVWNDTHVDYPEDGCLHELFAAQAMRSPDAVALVFDQRPTTNDQRPTTTDDRPMTNPSTRLGAGDQRPTTSRSPLHPFTPSPLQQLTYHELNERANQLAHHLRTLGVGPEVPVGICLERSLELLVALLGVLKAGGTYLPLDPSYPAARLAFMLADSQAAVLITTTGATDKETRPAPSGNEGRQGDKEIGVRGQGSGVRERQTQNSKLKTQNSPSPPHPLTLSDAWPAIALCAANNPVGALDPANLAYVIYTSGSTGTPKGAMNTQRGIVNRLRWMQDAYGLNGDDVVLHKTSISFDVSVWELVWPLLTGARLVLARPGGQRDSAYLAALIATERITTLHFVPSMLAVFLEAPQLEQCRTLRRIICSGEALPPALAARCCARLGAELHNLYGPTEAAVDVTAWRYTGTGAETVVLIGRPIANTQCYVLDAHLHPVPIGAAGELYLGGVQLARGYLGRPDLTAERFVPNPFADQEQRTKNKEQRADGTPATQNSKLKTQNLRLYRTGDRARYRPDGAIEFLGRIDEQVKLRGFRIEPGEIESVLRQHPDVRECAVVAREDAPGEKRLVTYVVSKIEDRGLKIEDSGSDAPDPLSSIFYPLSSELRSFLQQRLPDYMIPSAFVPLPALPLTANGKLDRGALPAPGQARADRPDAYVAPRSAIELDLARIWEDLLQVRPIGVTDNFFDLGGHSLLAVRLLAQIQAHFGRELPLAALFQGATIEQLAQLLQRERGPESRSPLVAIQPRGTKPPLFCVHAVGGSAFAYIELARHLGADQPLYGLQAPGLDGEQQPYDRIEALAEHYLAAQREVQPQGPYLLGGWSTGGVVAFEMARQLQQRGQQVALLALLDSWATTYFQPGAFADADDAAVMAEFVWDLGRQSGTTLDLSLADLQRLEHDEQAQLVLEQAHASHALPADLTLAQLRRHFEVFRANRQAVRSYVPQRAPGPLTLFRAVDQPSQDGADPALGWGAWAASPVAVVEVPGDHYSMLAAPHVAVLAGRLRGCVDAALAATAARTEDGR